MRIDDFLERMNNLDFSGFNQLSKDEIADLTSPTIVAALEETAKEVGDQSAAFWLKVSRAILTHGARHLGSKSCDFLYAQHKEARAYDLHKQMGSVEKVAHTFENASAAYFQLGNIDKAIKCRRNQAAIQSVSGRKRGNIQQLQEALAACLFCLQEATSGTPPELLADYHANLGYVHLCLGQINNDVSNLQAAAAAYRKAYELIANSPRHHELKAKVKNSLGVVLSKWGELKASLELLFEANAHYRAAAEIRQNGDEGKYLNTLTNIAHCELMICNLRQDFERLDPVNTSLENTLSKCSKAGISRSQLSDTYRQLASNYHTLAQHRKSPDERLLAKRYYQRSLELLSEKNSPYLHAQITSHLASVLFRLGEYRDDPNLIQEAIRLHERIKQGFGKKEHPYWWANQCHFEGVMYRRLYKHSGRPDHLEAAVLAYRKALEIFESPATRLLWAETQKRVCLCLADLASTPEDWQRLAQECTKLIKTVRVDAQTSSTTLQQRRQLRSIDGIGDLCAYSLLMTGKTEEALRYLLLCRMIGADLTSSLAASSPELKKPPQPSHLSRWKQLKATIDRKLLDLNPDTDLSKTLSVQEIDQINDVYRDVESDIERAAREGLESINPSFLAQNLQSNSCAVAVYVSDLGGGIFILTKSANGLMHRNLPDLTLNRVKKLLGEEGSTGWHEAYAQYRAATDAGSSEEIELAVWDWNSFLEIQLPHLWKILMGLIADILEKPDYQYIDHVDLLVPGILANLPLHAAFGGNDLRAYFCQRWSVTYCLNPVQIGTLVPTEKPSKDFLVAITDQIDPESRLENPAWRLFDSDHKTDVPANATKLKAALTEWGSACTYLCYFGHGIWNSQTPDNSSLLLADDTVMSSADFRLFDFPQLQLAILAACESGLVGTSQLPNEFIGLPSSLLQAGAQSVIASQWLVDADFSYLLTQRTMELVKMGTSPAKALQVIQNQFLDGLHDQSFAGIPLHRRLMSAANIRLLDSTSPSPHTRFQQQGTSQFQENSEPFTAQMPFFWASFCLYK